MAPLLRLGIRSVAPRALCLPLSVRRPTPALAWDLLAIFSSHLDSLFFLFFSISRHTRDVVDTICRRAINDEIKMMIKQHAFILYYKVRNHNINRMFKNKY